MSDTPSDSSTPLAEIAHGPSKFEQFLENNQKLLLLVAILIAVGAAAYVVMVGVEKGKQETAGASMIDALNEDELKKMIDEHSGSKAAKSAKLLLAETQWTTNERQASIATLRSFLADEADHPAAATAKASLASKLVTEGKSEEAVPMFEDLVDDPATRHLSAYALISLGDIAAAAGDTDKAKSHYERVNAEFSDSDFSASASSRLRDLGAVAPVEVAAPENLEEPGGLKPSEGTGNNTTPKPSNDPEADAAEAALDKEITLDPTKLPTPNNPLIPSEDK